MASAFSLVSNPRQSDTVMLMQTQSDHWTCRSLQCHPVHRRVTVLFTDCMHGHAAVTVSPRFDDFKEFTPGSFSSTLS